MGSTKTLLEVVKEKNIQSIKKLLGLGSFFSKIKNFFNFNHKINFNDIDQRSNALHYAIENLKECKEKWNKLLSKPAYERQVQEAHGAGDRSILDIHEDLSTGATTQLPAAEVEFRKKSIQSSVREWLDICYFLSKRGAKFDSIYDIIFLERAATEYKVRLNNKKSSDPLSKFKNYLLKFKEKFEIKKLMKHFNNQRKEAEGIIFRISYIIEKMDFLKENGFLKIQSLLSNSNCLNLLNTRDSFFTLLIERLEKSLESIINDQKLINTVYNELDNSETYLKSVIDSNNKEILGKPNITTVCSNFQNICVLLIENGENVLFEKDYNYISDTLKVSDNKNLPNLLLKQEAKPQVTSGIDPVNKIYRKGCETVLVQLEQVFRERRNGPSVVENTAQI